MISDNGKRWEAYQVFGKKITIYMKEKNFVWNSPVNKNELNKLESFKKELQDSSNREHVTKNAVKELKVQVEDIFNDRDKLSAAWNFYITHVEELITERKNCADDVVSV